jgi:plastocyanin
MKIRSCMFAAALVGTLLPMTTAQAADPVVTVQAGATNPDNPLAPYEYTRFYPEVAKVHPGDTVRFELVSFHNVTFVPDGEPIPNFTRDDELGIALSDAALSANCAESCVLSSTDQYLTTGVDWDTADIQIDLPVGDYDYICHVHPSMTGTISVVPVSEPLPSPATIAAEVAAEIAADTATADAFMADFQAPAPVVEDGVTVHTAYAGASTDDNHVAIMAMLPINLDVAAGDRVRWIAGGENGALDEIHTVTFPTALVGTGSFPPDGFATGFLLPACDLDDNESGAPGIPAGPIVADCAPENFEVFFPAWSHPGTSAPGDAVLTPLTIHNSGVLAPEAQPDWAKNTGSSGVFPSTFEASFPLPGDFSYACIVHPFMVASVTAS